MRHECSLTELGIRELERAMRAGGPINTILSLWRIIEPNYEEMETVKPSDYAIGQRSYRQFFDVMDTYRDHKGDHGTYMAAVGMEMANIGPSQF
jgi:hypothetical protein